ncbi:MAG: arginine decarboxylase, pyruvoyl-dependent [Bacillota bacterium]|nr:arginine decarboxylase, pyruvoyl-dependent [Bacillota bacterium]
MLPVPTKFTLCAGSAEGVTRLNAFDNALREAGIANLNLLKVTSILPPGCRYEEKLSIAPGSLTPTAYGSITCDVPGTRIAAAVAVGLSEDSFGVIMEFAGECSRQEAEERVARMAEEAFRQRGMKMARLMTRGTELVVEKIGCAFAAVALWY